MSVQTLTILEKVDIPLGFLQAGMYRVNHDSRVDVETFRQSLGRFSLSSFPRFEDRIHPDPSSVIYCCPCVERSFHAYHLNSCSTYINRVNNLQSADVRTDPSLGLPSPTMLHG